MDYEKEYKEALERARQIHSENRAQPFNVMANVFKELKESDDEKIRKDIQTYLHNELQNIQQLTPRTNEFERWIAWLEKQGEQKPVEWSDKDEGELREIIEILTQRPFIGTFFLKKHIAWLKALKDRVQPQPKQEWSEEDGKNLKECIIAVSMSEGHTLKEKEQLENWLKSLRPHNNP